MPPTPPPQVQTATSWHLTEASKQVLKGSNTPPLGARPGPAWVGQALSDSPLTPPLQAVNQVLGPTLGTRDQTKAKETEAQRQAYAAAGPALNNAAIARSIGRRPAVQSPQAQAL